MKKLSDVISEDTWGQCSQVLLERRMCLGLWFCDAFAPDSTHKEWEAMIQRLEKILRRLWPERHLGEMGGLSGIMYFNDHPETTFADVQKAAREYDLETDLHDA
jgi:hypothetical protein